MMKKKAVMTFESKEIIVTKEFLEKAKVMGSQEFKEYLAIKREFPDYRITTK